MSRKKFKCVNFLNTIFCVLMIVGLREAGYFGLSDHNLSTNDEEESEDEENDACNNGFNIAKKGNQKNINDIVHP